MAANNKAVKALVDMGADAQKNMYDVWIQFPWMNGEDTLVSTRATGFTIPQAVVGSEERAYHGSKITTPTSEVTIDRKFDMTFRLDASYALYQQFITWHQTVADPVSGGVANWATATGIVKCKALSGTYAATGIGEYTDAEGAIVESDDNAQWTFYDVWVGEVAQPAFANDGGGHIEYKVQFYCGDIDYPFYNSAGIKGTGSGGATEQ